MFQITFTNSLRECNCLEFAFTYNNIQQLFFCCSNLGRNRWHHRMTAKQNRGSDAASPKKKCGEKEASMLTLNVKHVDWLGLIYIICLISNGTGYISQAFPIKEADGVGRSFNQDNHCAYGSSGCCQQLWTRGSDVQTLVQGQFDGSNFSSKYVQLMKVHEGITWSEVS